MQRLASIFALSMLAITFASALKVTSATDGELAITIRADWGNQAAEYRCYRDYSIERSNFENYFSLPSNAAIGDLQDTLLSLDNLESPQKYDSGVECCTTCDASGFCDVNCVDLPVSSPAAQTHVCQTRCPSMPLRDELLVPGTYNFSFRQPADSCGVKVPLQQDCGNGQISAVFCINSTCTFNCEYSGEQSCPDGVCAVELSACGPSKCSKFDRSTGKWSNCTAADCSAGSGSWESCMVYDLNLREIPSGCTFGNPSCGANEYCKDNNCVKRECNESSQCGTTYGCAAFSCSDYKCVGYILPGCEYLGECYAYGYRPIIENKTFYCAFSRDVLPLKKNEDSCMEAFECESNMCFEGACRDIPTIDAFFNWLGETFRGFMRWMRGLFESPAPTPVPGN